MMRKGGHPMKPPGHRDLRPGFEKTTHNLCPSCGGSDLTVYFRSGSSQRVGAYCYSCGLVGFFARNDFFELGRIAPDLIPDQTISKLSGG